MPPATAAAKNRLSMQRPEAPPALSYEQARERLSLPEPASSHDVALPLKGVLP